MAKTTRCAYWCVFSVGIEGLSTELRLDKEEEELTLVVEQFASDAMRLDGALKVDSCTG